MSIGTAAPTVEELKAVKHYFIHHKSIQENYSVGDFENEAIDMINSLFKEHSTLILVGGSGLYVNAVTKGFDSFPVIDPNIRQTLNKKLEDEGLGSLQEELKRVDPLSYDKIEIQNPHRVIRALEVSLGTDKPYSSYLTRESKSRPFNIITLGLTADREIIYSRINERVDHMIEEGLIKEAKQLFEHRELNALNTVGYKELFNYFSNEWTLEHAVSEIKKNTRRFAKRQLTWFRKDPSILWFDYNQNYDEICTTIKHKIEKPT